MKMKELEQRTGVGRETIRYYIRIGLLAPPERPKRNVARYGDEHVRGLAAIRKLQHERFLPLSVIRSVVSDGEGLASADVKTIPGLDTLLSARLQVKADETVPLDAALASAGATLSELEDLIAIGAVHPTGAGKTARLTSIDAAILALWGRAKAAGYNAANGYTPRNFGIEAEAAKWVAENEVRQFYDRVAGRRDPAEAAKLGEAGVVLGNEMFGLLRMKAILKVVEEMTAGRGRKRRKPKALTPVSRMSRARRKRRS